MSHQSISTNDLCNLQCTPTFTAHLQLYIKVELDSGKKLHCMILSLLTWVLSKARKELVLADTEGSCSDTWQSNVLVGAVKFWV